MLALLKCNHDDRFYVGCPSDDPRSAAQKQPQVVEYVNNCDLSQCGQHRLLPDQVMGGDITTCDPRDEPPRECDGQRADGLLDARVVMQVVSGTNGAYEHVVGPRLAMCVGACVAWLAVRAYSTDHSRRLAHPTLRITK